jgi:hypothetical protein
LLEDVQLYMDTLHQGGLKTVVRDHNETVDKGHVKCTPLSRPIFTKL